MCAVTLVLPGDSILVSATSPEHQKLWNMNYTKKPMAVPAGPPRAVCRVGRLTYVVVCRYGDGHASPKSFDLLSTITYCVIMKQVVHLCMTASKMWIYSG